MEMERGYPRPRGECDGCQLPIVLCWGEKTTPYWRHISKEGCDITNPGESQIHKLAKSYLCNFLTSGGRLEVVTRCTRCGLSKRKNVKRCTKYQLEVKVRGGSFDVCGISKDEMIGFEIAHTHKTTNLKSRSIYEWYEFKANHILDQLDRKDVVTQLTLYDIRTDRVCNLEDNELCVDHLTIAKRLGYYKILTRYPREILRILDEASTGYYIPDREWWSLKSHQHPYNVIIEGWQLTKTRFFNTYGELVVRERCLRCDLPRKGIELGRPFCRKCYTKTKRENKDAHPNDWIYSIPSIPTDLSPFFSKKSRRIRDLRDALKFMDAIPTFESKGSVFFPCTVCEYTIIPTVEWKGFIRSICLDCIEEKFCE